MATFTDIELERFTDRHSLASLIGFVPRQIFFVCNASYAAGSDTANDGLTRSKPFATLSTALSKCNPSQGDAVIVMPGHAETTGATAYALNVAGVAIVGLGIGRNRPAFTANATAVDAFSLTAANVMVRNIRFIGAASSTALIDIGASDFTAENCVFEHGAAPLSAITVSAGDRWKFKNCKFVGTADGPDRCIDVECHCVDWEFTDNIVDYGTFGLDNDIIRANADSIPGGTFNNVIASGLTLLALDFNSSTNATGDGIVSNSVFAFIAGITANGGTVPCDVGGYNFVNVRWADVAAGRDVYIPGTTVT